MSFHILMLYKHFVSSTQNYGMLILKRLFYLLSNNFAAIFLWVCLYYILQCSSLGKRQIRVVTLKKTKSKFNRARIVLFSNYIQQVLQKFGLKVQISANRNDSEFVATLTIAGMQKNYCKNLSFFIIDYFVQSKVF